MCYIFGQRNVPSFNAARFNIFQTTCEFNCTLPPCQNSLWLHARRINYLAAICRLCLHVNINAPSPTNHGWKYKDQRLVVHWSSLPTTPSTLSNLVKGNSKKNSSNSRRCSCVRQILPCTGLCQFVACCNMVKEYKDNEILQNHEIENSESSKDE